MLETSLVEPPQEVVVNSVPMPGTGAASLPNFLGQLQRPADKSTTIIGPLDLCLWLFFPSQFSERLNSVQFGRSSTLANRGGHPPSHSYRMIKMYVSSCCSFRSKNLTSGGRSSNSNHTAIESTMALLPRVVH